MTSLTFAPNITGLTPVRPLGSGGFSHVYLYEQDFPRRPVAVKVLSGAHPSAQAHRAFLAEADVLARLSSHPAIVSVWGAGVAHDGRPYLSLEYCPGSWRERTRGRPAALQDVLDVGVRLAGALASIHANGVLHRDVKPSNVLVSTTGRPVLTDFGIAASVSTAQGLGKTAPVPAFSIPWSAPEVVTQQTTGTVASEVWALGATLYSFAAGRSPFELDDPQKNSGERLIRRIAQGQYTPVPGARGYEPVDAVLATAMRVVPQHRYRDLREFGLALQNLQRHYGWPVTQLEIIEAGWAPQAPHSREIPTTLSTETEPHPATASTIPQSRSARRLERDAAQPQHSHHRVSQRTNAILVGGAIFGGAAVIVSATVWLLTGMGAP